MLAAGPMIKEKISATMALIDGSERLESWYRPPVQPHLESYAFHVTNPNAVLEGKKPILQEVGPFVYKSTTVKDSDNNVKFWSDATLTYRPRKVYQFVPEKSCETCKNPDETMITVPNIPFWTRVNKGSKAGADKHFAYDLANTIGLAQPFIEGNFKVKFSLETNAFSFYKSKTVLDMVQDVKFRSEKLFLVFSKTFGFLKPPVDLHWFF